MVLLCGCTVYAVIMGVATRCAILVLYNCKQLEQFARMTNPTRNRFRTWQCSIRTLMLVMLIVGSYLGGWISNEWKWQQELERAQKEMEVEVREDLEALVQFLTEPSPVSDD